MCVFVRSGGGRRALPAPRRDASFFSLFLFRSPWPRQRRAGAVELVVAVALRDAFPGPHTVGDVFCARHMGGTTTFTTFWCRSLARRCRGKTRRRTPFVVGEVDGGENVAVVRARRRAHPWTGGGARAAPSRSPPCRSRGARRPPPPRAARAGRRCLPERAARLRRERGGVLFMKHDRDDSRRKKCTRRVVSRERGCCPVRICPRATYPQRLQSSETACDVRRRVATAARRRGARGALSFVAPPRKENQKTLRDDGTRPRRAYLSWRCSGWRTPSSGLRGAPSVPAWCRGRTRWRRARLVGRHALDGVRPPRRARARHRPRREERVAELLLLCFFPFQPW